VKGLEVAKGLKELISTLRLVVLAANVSSVCLAIISQRPAGLGGRIIGSTATQETFRSKEGRQLHVILPGNMARSTVRSSG
jgi:hypothetical protein